MAAEANTEEAAVAVWRPLMHAEGDHMTLINIYNAFMERTHTTPPSAQTLVFEPPPHEPRDALCCRQSGRGVVRRQPPQPRRLTAGGGHQGGAAGGDAEDRTSCFPPGVWMSGQLHEHQASAHLRLLPQSKNLKPECLYFLFPAVCIRTLSIQFKGRETGSGLLGYSIGSLDFLLQKRVPAEPFCLGHSPTNT